MLGALTIARKIFPIPFPNYSEIHSKSTQEAFQNHSQKKLATKKGKLEKSAENGHQKEGPTVADECGFRTFECSWGLQMVP